MAVAKSWLSAEAPPGTALAGRSAVVAMTTPSRIAELSDLLRDDEVHAHVCAVEDAPALAELEKPMLLLLEDTGDDGATQACRAIRRLRDIGDGLSDRRRQGRASTKPERMVSMTGLPMFSWSPTRRIMRERGSGRGSCVRLAAGCGPRNRMMKTGGLRQPGRLACGRRRPRSVLIALFVLLPAVSMSRSR